MKKKLLAALLAVAMTATMLTGCGGGTAEEEGVTSGDDVQTEADAGEAEDEVVDVAEVTLSFWSLGTVPSEAAVAEVEAAINEITEPEIGVTLNLNIMDVGTYIPNGAMANGVANGEDFDIVCTAAALSGHYYNMFANGMLMDITDLLDEYGQDLLATVPGNWLDATSSQGKVYAVPTYANKAKSMYWFCKNEALEAAEIDITTIKTIDDVEAALYKIHEVMPDGNAIGGASQTLDLMYPGYNLEAGADGLHDTLGDSTGVAAVVYLNDDTLTAVSRYENEDMVAIFERLAKWNKDGLVDRDAATETANATPFDNPATLSCVYVGQEDVAQTRCAAADASYVKLTDGVIDTAVMQQFTWALPTSCDEPEAAMKFMNLAYTNEEICNLLNYGIEGKHYVWDEAAGTIGFPEGVTAENSEYYLGGAKALLGNAFLAYPWTGADPKTSELGLKAMESAVYSPLLGFSLDTAALGDAWGNIGTISKSEYFPALSTGTAPEGFYEEFIDKLYAAGLQECIDEINAQIDAWLEAQNK